jgi:hyperpolarization activated cyclic nucleotide-gated potassium channel 2
MSVVGILDINSTYSDKYATSVYWAVTTMATIGYGDITPITTYEKIYVMVSMLVASAVFAFIVGSISSIFVKSETIISDFKYILFDVVIE